MGLPRSSNFMKRIAIIGGGIAGLSAAFYLQRAREQGAALEYVLYERSARLGGVLQTEEVDGFLLEAGPDSFLTVKPWAAQLARDAGLGDQIIPSLDHARKVHIVLHGKLVPMPAGLHFMVPSKMLPALMSPLFSWATRAQIAREALWSRPQASPKKLNDGGMGESAADESAASLVSRHFGQQMVDRVANPLLAGVYGGEASQLSARAVLPGFVEMEAQHGSLIRGVRAQLAAKAAAASAATSAPSPSIFTSFKKGMQQLVDAVSSGIDPQCVHLNAKVEAVTRDTSGWNVRRSQPHEGNGKPFDSVALAVPAYVSATLIEAESPALAVALNQIPYGSSVLILMAYDEEVARNLPDGFGFLAPRSEGLRMLACTMVHNKFAGRAPAGAALLRVFMGGAGDEAAISLSDDEIQSIVRKELRQILGLTSAPRFCRIYRWPRAMAQYNVGHLLRIAEIQAAAAKSPGLFLAGNAYRGIGVPDCVRSGAEVAQQIIGERSP